MVSSHAVEIRSTVSRLRHIGTGPVCMALAVLGAIVAAAPADPPEVLRVRHYLSSYQRAFAAVIADETTTQTVRRGAQPVQTQTSRGEFFTTFAGSDGIWMSVHDVTEVEGRQVEDRVDLTTLLATRSPSAVGPELARANARFNIGPILRNFNEPTLALQLLAPRMAGAISFSIERQRGLAAADAKLTIAAKLADRAPFVGSARGRRVSTRAIFIVEPDTGRILETSLSVDDGEIEALLETEYARNERLELWLPAVFKETYTRRDESTMVTTRFSNYRRFETKGRIVQ